MKKIYGIVIIFVAVLIIIGIFYFININKNNTTEADSNSINSPSTNNVNNEVASSNTNNENIIKEEQNNTKEIEEIVSFNGYTAEEWKNMIVQFYGNYTGIQITEVICKYDEDGNFTADVATEYEVCGQYVFNKETTFATEKNMGLTVDFINGKIVNQVKDKSKIFTDNLCLAAGYVTSATQAKFIEKYFSNEASYNSITKYDLRSEYNAENEKTDKVVIIPKDENVEISIYDCKIEENGELNKGNMLLEKISEPFMILYDNIEQTTPQMCIELKVNGFEDIIPIVFSGNNGHLDLTGHESEVLDISIY